MSRLEAWLVHAAFLLVTATGLAYGWTCYFATPVDADALENHPWQGELQHAHILVAPLLVFACGLVWTRHVWARWRSREPERRRTGALLALGLAPMVVSGYLVQTAIEDDWRQAWVVVHVASSVLWVAAYVVHQVSPRPAAG